MDPAPTTYRVAIIGCGRGGPGVGEHSIGYAHAFAYERNPRTRIVGACDLSRENLAPFAARFHVPHAHTDARAMLDAARPDIVSVCTYAGSRRAAVETVAATPGVRGIWSEKPLALALDDVRAIVASAARHDLRMIVNFCRRPRQLFREVKRLLDAGAIGRPMFFLAAIEDWDQAEWGSHWHDMIRFLMDEQRVQWVMGQARCTGAKRRFGHVMEEHSVAYYGFADGTRALVDGGLAFNTGTGLASGTALRIIGATGFIDCGWDDKVTLLNPEGWREIATRDGLMHPGDGTTDNWQQMLADLVAWLDGGAEPATSARNALHSHEIYLAAWESARRGDRIDLPLESQPTFPLDAIVARQTGP